MGVSYTQAILASLAVSAVAVRLPAQYMVFSSFTPTFLSLAVLSLSALSIWRMFLWPFVFSPLRHLPEPKGGSLIHGQMYTIIAEETGAPLRRFLRDVPNDGLIRYRHMFNTERVLIASPKALAEVLVTKNYEFVKPSFFRDNLGRLLGNGILFAEGDEHKRQRRLLMPAFSFRHIKDLYPVFWDKGCEVVEAMTEEAKENGLVDVGPWASRVTLDIIGVAGMGHDFNSVKDPNGELSRCYKRVFSFNPSVTMQLLRDILPFRLMANLPIKRNQEVREARATIRRICNDLIDKKRVALDKGVTGRDILSVALESGGFSNDNLVDQLMTFLAAGHETTASAMLWACYLLCEHRDVQARLRAEIRERLPSPSAADAAKVTSADIDGAPYLNAFCNEVLRFFPSVPMTVRLADRDTTVLGQVIPKGTTIIVSPWAVNVNEELWGPDAESFNPDRWLGADGRAQHTGGAGSNYSFLTFIHGPRSCIGQNFAKAEFACLVAAWAGRFDMRFENDDYVLKIGGGVTSKPKGGLKVRMTPLEGW